MTSETPILDCYPVHKPLIFGLIETAHDHPMHMHILWYAMQHLVEIIGDDELYFEFQGIYETLEHTKKGDNND